METETIKKQKVTNKGSLVNPEYLTGRWKMIYTPENVLKDAFGVKLLPPYRNPFTKELIFPLDENNVPMLGFAVDQLVSYFNPDKDDNLEHYNAIAFLIGHPEVNLPGVPIDEKFASQKQDNCKITLVSIDFADQEEMQDQEIIDLMLGRLSFETGKLAIGLEKIEWVLAKLNLPFRDKRYINDKGQLKRQLRKVLKNHIRGSAEKASEVETILDNLEDAKKHWVVLSCIDLDLFTFSAGTFKHQNHPIGFNVESCVDYLKMNSEHYAMLQTELYKELAK